MNDITISNNTVTVGLNNKVDLDLGNSNIEEKLNTKYNKTGGKLEGDLDLQRNYHINRTPFIKGTIKEEDTWIPIAMVQDSEEGHNIENRLAGLRYCLFSNGTSTIAINAFKNINSEEFIGDESDSVSLSLSMRKDGTTSTNCPTPPDNSNTTEIATTAWVNKKIMPVGSIYVQYPSQSDPTTLFGGTWSNISSTYAGLFFRSEGGSAAAFGSNQSGGLPNITGVLAFRGGDIGTSANIDASDFNKINGAFKSVQKIQWYDGKDNHKGYPEIDTSYGGYIDFNASRSSSAYQDGITEVRPVNSTIRIWKRTK